MVGMVRASIFLKVLFLLAGVVLAGWPGASYGASFGAASGGALHAGSVPSMANPLLTPVASQCVALGKRNGRELLVNRCGSCQIVKLSRKRPGNKPAIHRTYTVPAKSKTELSFRGPGQTRVTSSRPCRPEAPKSTENESDDKKCAQFQRRIDGGVIIVNTCTACREVLTERLGAGNFKSAKTYVIAGKSYVPVESQNASQARILAERKCKR